MVFRIGISRLIAVAKPKMIGETVFSRNISGKSLRGTKQLIKKPPFDYKNKKYTFLRAFFLDRTTHRLDENSKVIVVEGPPTAGKTKLAKELAEELEMMHFPEANLDLLYINGYGYDMRQLDSQLPDRLRSFDIKNFCENPNHLNVAAFQILMYQQRCSQYIDALAHLFNTGQGVVLERSPYSDYVFVEAMYKHGYISKGARSIYYELRDNTLDEFMRPHLVVYLDVPIKTVQERIKQRNIPYEVNSKVFTQSYLESIEYHYKQKFLKDFSFHGELLVYDWSDYGDTEVVVEDIERIDFDNFDTNEKKFRDWYLPKEWDYATKRAAYTNEKADLMNNFNVARFDVPELIMEAEDAELWWNVWKSAPGMKYAYGYNEDMGDKNILFKTKMDDRDRK